MFLFATFLQSNLSQWEVPSLFNMEGMFLGAQSFSSNLCTWNQYFVSKVQNTTTTIQFDDMFLGSGCPNQTKPNITKGGPWCYTCTTSKRKRGNERLFFVPSY